MTATASAPLDISAMPQTSSPLNSPGLHYPRSSLELNAAPVSPEIVEKKKKKYSANLYEWTREMWENARQDIERRSSVSSGSSSFGSQSYENEEKAGNQDLAACRASSSV